MINYLLPMREKAAINQQLGHPAQGVIGWLSPSDNASGVAVDENLALNYSAVWCATRVISETVASLPCILYRREGNGDKTRATDDPRFSLIHDDPSSELSAYTFFEVLTGHVVGYGNAYATIGRRDGMPVELEVRHPTEVTPKDEGGRIVYDIDGQMIPWEDMLHTIGLSSGTGIIGDSVITRAKLTIGSALAAEKYAGGFFKSSGVPSGVLTHPERLNKEAREAFRRDWEKEHDGQSKLAILHGGITYQSIGMSHEDAQFLESRQFSVQEIARWFRIPPHFLAELSRSTFSNIEQQSIDFVVYSLTPWLKRWEASLSKKLLRQDERPNLFFEFLTNALLRGDIKSRYDAYSAGRTGGWLSANDVRRAENMNSLDENGDIYLQPMNMVEAGSEAEDRVASEFRSNLSASIDQIRSIARDVATGAESVSTADERMSAVLDSLREERKEITRELETLREKPTAANVAFESVKSAAIDLLQAKLEYSLKLFASRAEKAARRQLHRGEPFLKWLDDYAEQHRQATAAAVADLCSTYCSLGSGDADTLSTSLAESQTEFCRSSLLSASEVVREEFESSITACISDWREHSHERVTACMNF